MPVRGGSVHPIEARSAVAIHAPHHRRMDRFVPRDDESAVIARRVAYFVIARRVASSRHCVHGRSLFSKLFL